MKKLDIHNKKVVVTAQFREYGSILRGTKTGECLGFNIDLSLSSDEPQEIIAELIRLSRQICFTQSALTHNTPITFTHTLNPDP